MTEMRFYNPELAGLDADYRYARAEWGPFEAIYMLDMLMERITELGWENAWTAQYEDFE